MRKERKISESETSSSEDVSFDCVSETESETFSDLEEETSVPVVDQDPDLPARVNDFCIVKFAVGERQNKVKHYIGQVLQADTSKGQYKMKFLRRTRDKFKFPIIDDLSWVGNDNIIRKVTVHAHRGSTSRQTNIYSFDNIATSELMNLN